jgi:hypothetical protein
MSDDEKKEVKGSPWLLVIFMVIVGAVTIFLAVFGYIVEYAIFGATYPSWWPFTGAGTATFEQAVLVPIGFWMFIGAFGLAKEKDWALGVSFVCLTTILYQSAKAFIDFVTWAISQIPSVHWVTNWATWVLLILVIFSAIGFIYLLATHKRYH